MDKTFSVLTVSKRTGWEESALVAIHGQTAPVKDWTIVTDRFDEFPESWSTLAPDIRVFRAPELVRASSLNASLNAGLRLITTDYVIFYQDFIKLPKDCFEKLLELSDERTFVTTCTPNYDGSDDSRYLGLDAPRVCRPNEWETNVAIAPMKILREIGGFEEELDWGWSWDNVLVAQKAAMLGCKFIIDESNRPKLLPHEQTSKLELELNGDRCAKILYDIRMGHRPFKSPYLQ